jgi:tetratricopeptide (TPR) repeat protein
VTHVTGGARIGPLPTLLDRRDDLLDEQSRAVLDLAATLGAEFDAELLAIGQGLPLLSVLDSLERAEAAGLVVSLPGPPGRFGFVHALFRSHRYHRLPVRRRLELHANAATALATRDGRQLPEQARHACLAVPLIDARTAVELARAAGDAAEHAYAYDEAASHYQRGLDAVQSLEPPDPHASLDLTVRLAAAVHHSNDPRGLAMLIDAADRARREGDTAALVRVATSFSSFGTSGAFAGPAAAELAVIEDALASLGSGPSASRALLLIELTAQIALVRVDEAVALAREAESIAREIGDPELLGRVYLGARLIGHHPSRLEEFERIAAELEALGRRHGTFALTFIALYDRAVGHLERGQVAMWAQLSEQAATLLGDRSLPVLQLHARSLLATRAFLDGDLERTEHQALSTAPLATALGHEPLAWSGGILVVTRRLQARDGEMLSVVESIEPRGAFTVARYVLAAMQARVGAADDAKRTVAALRDDAYPVQETSPWTLAMSELAEAAEVAGDPEAAAHVLAQCSPFTGRIAVAGPCANRPFDQALAQAALAVGDTPLAENYAQRAVEASRHRRTPLFLARELVFLAAARRRNGGATDEVRPLVAEALALAHRHGARVVPVDVDRYGLPT